MAPKKKSKEQKKSKAFERVYLILTLVAVAGVAIFLGYVVGQYAIQAATNALDREIAQEGDRVRQQVAETARQTPPNSAAQVDATPEADDTRGPGTRLQSPSESTPPSPSREVQPAVEPTPKPAPGVPQTVPAATSSKQLFRVQVGAFSSEVNAQSLAGELRDKGYQVLVVPGSLHRVQVGAFAERSNAETLKRELESKGFPAAIISTD
jgi:cell division septation protein DedD